MFYGKVSILIWSAPGSCHLVRDYITWSKPDVVTWTLHLTHWGREGEGREGERVATRGACTKPDVNLYWFLVVLSFNTLPKTIGIVAGMGLYHETTQNPWIFNVLWYMHPVQGANRQRQWPVRLLCIGLVTVNGWYKTFVLNFDEPATCVVCSITTCVTHAHVPQWPPTYLVS